MLVGREHEQQVVERLVAGALTGTSGVLALTGEPGVGKTALLRWAETRLDGFRVLRATGTDLEREVPFAALLTVLRPALGLLDTLAGPQARALSGALALGDEEAGDRFAVGAATLSLLCRYAEEAPVAVVLDDVHLVDRPSAGALLFAARRLATDAVVVLVAAREGEAEDLVEGLDRLVVPGLGPAAARALAESVSGAPVTDDRLARLQALTGGNPLAIAELSSEADALLPTGTDVPVPLPSALTASYARRLRGLAAEVRSVLLVAAVSNGDRRLTGEVCGALGLDPAQLLDAQHAGLAVVSAAEVTFRHPLLRAAVYSDSPPGERRAVHAAVAAALPDDDIDRRAWHLSEARWSPDAEVADLLAEAAVRAAARSAHAVASAAYERSARLTPDAAEVPSRLLGAAEAAWRAGLGPRALLLLDELAAYPLADATALHALQLRATVAARSGSLREAHELLTRAAAAGATADERALLLAEALEVTFFLADANAAGRLADELEHAVAAATTPGARAVGTLATGMAKVLAGRGGVEELRAAVPMLAEAPELRDDSNAPWLMYAPLFIRDTGTGRELRARVEDARDRAGVTTLPWLLLLVARDAATSDAWPRAAADYTEAVRLARDTGQTTELAVSLAGLAWLEARTGAAGCRAHAEEALALARVRDIHLAEAWALLALGDAAVARADAAGAVEVLGRLDDLLARLGVGDPDVSPGPDVVWALVRLGRREEAAATAEAFRAAAEAKGQPWSCARAHRSLALVAGDADAHFREAIALHQQTPDRFETARTELAYGEVLRRTGQRVEARGHLRAALSTFTALGAEPWADQAATELDLTGERVPPRPVGGIAALTPQELQVALLLADGRTTRQAAAALFLSPKTVEYHLRKVYTKLGVRSRAELAEQVAAT